MKFIISVFNKTALNIAVENGSVEIVQLLLTKKNIDVNIPSILNNVLFNTISYVLY